MEEVTQTCHKDRLCNDDDDDDDDYDDDDDDDDFPGVLVRIQYGLPYKATLIFCAAI